jgi:hypothetical protein
MSKPFDAALYENDDDAKFLVIRWLESRGHEICVNPDQYGIDLLGSWHDRRYAWEVEVKHNWRGFDFPFDSVHYSVRKRKCQWQGCDGGEDYPEIHYLHAR